MVVDLSKSSPLPVSSVSPDPSRVLKDESVELSVDSKPVASLNMIPSSIVESVVASSNVTPSPNSKFCFFSDCSKRSSSSS